MTRIVLSLVIAALLTIGYSRTSHADDAKLRQAYQREFAFLEAERNSLKSRLEQLRTDNASKRATAQAEVDALQGQVLGIATEAERMTEQLLDAERQADTSGDGADQLESTLQQMSAALEKGKLKLPEVK